MVATTTRKTAASKRPAKPEPEPLDGIGALVDLETLAAALGLSKAFVRRQCSEGTWRCLALPRRGGVRFAFTQEHVAEIVASLTKERKRGRR